MDYEYKYPNNNCDEKYECANYQVFGICYCCNKPNED